MLSPRQLVTLLVLGGAVFLAASDMANFSPLAVENAVTPGRDWDPPTGAIALNAGAGAIEIPLPAAVGSLYKTAPSESDAGSFKIPMPGAVGPLKIKNSLLDTKSLDTPLPTVLARLSEAVTSDPDPVPPAVARVSTAEAPVIEAPLLLAPRPDRAPETTEKLASLAPADKAKELSGPAERPSLTIDECAAIDSCVDEYLWSLYERTPKLDTNKVTEKIKKAVKKKGKLRTVMTTITKYIPGDFTWKDPAAAEKVTMPLKDYVIGGMDRRFRLTLYRALRVLDAAGFKPGITSAFRDDYRQSIAVGNKAASDSSYHGGSRRGGFGHGLAADLVSVKGETRDERYASSEEMWKWIDTHEKELGIGRPYLDRDPPHVGPLDGKEYADKRTLLKAKTAKSQTKKTKVTKATTATTATKVTTATTVEIKKHPLLNRVDPNATKRATDTTKPAKPEKPASKVSSLQSKVAVQR
jgi:hypothetical protein